MNENQSPIRNTSKTNVGISGFPFLWIHPQGCIKTMLVFREELEKLRQPRYSLILPSLPLAIFFLIIFLAPSFLIIHDLRVVSQNVAHWLGNLLIQTEENAGSWTSMHKLEETTLSHWELRSVSFAKVVLWIQRILTVRAQLWVESKWTEVIFY